ncbi:PTS glucose transporter subunit IIA [Sporosarcina sp. ANT_H38]|nr:PTS glucose transporter subunit IIA [Sporosarcina sp. ANT_H38]
MNFHTYNNFDNVTVQSGMSFAVLMQRLLMPFYNKGEILMLDFFTKNKSKKASHLTLHAISQGNLIPLEQVNDPVFSQKMMGDGIAIEVEDSQIRSPIDGTLIMFAQTNHAFGIRTSDGVEVLVHVGLDTVGLKGEGFQPKVAVDSQVKQGDVVLEIDIPFIQSKNIDLITPIIVSNPQQYTIEHTSAKEKVHVQDAILYLR